MEKYQTVQVRESQIRSTPSFLGKILCTIRYGDQLTALTEKDSWIQVDYRGKNGWMHSSALTEKEIVVAAGAKSAKHSASSDELALAGKGFTKEVEDEFRRKNKNLDFDEIDRIEQMTVSQAEIKSFLQTGGLEPEGGWA